MLTFVQQLTCVVLLFLFANIPLFRTLACQNEIPPEWKLIWHQRFCRPSLIPTPTPTLGIHANGNSLWQKLALMLIIFGCTDGISFWWAVTLFLIVDKFHNYVYVHCLFTSCLCTYMFEWNRGEAGASLSLHIAFATLLCGPARQNWVHCRQVAGQTWQCETVNAAVRMMFYMHLWLYVLCVFLQILQGLGKGAVCANVHSNAFPGQECTKRQDLEL